MVIRWLKTSRIGTEDRRRRFICSWGQRSPKNYPGTWLKPVQRRQEYGKLNECLFSEGDIHADGQPEDRLVRETTYLICGWATIVIHPSIHHPNVSRWSEKQWVGKSFSENILNPTGLSLRMAKLTDAKFCNFRLRWRSKNSGSETGAIFSLGWLA